MASSDAIYDIAFRHAGIERANSIEELFDCARLLVRRYEPSEGRLAIVTNAGGPGVMATDAWLGLGGQLAKLNRDTMSMLDRDLPACWSHGNPIDVLGDATFERFQVAIEHTIADQGVDAVLVIVTPQSMTQPGRIAETVIQACRQTNKPLIASFIGGPAMRESRDLLRQNDVPAYDFPEEATHALHHLVSANRKRATGHNDQLATLSSSRDHESSSTCDIPRDRLMLLKRELAGCRGLLGESRSKELMAEYGIPTAVTLIAHSADEAAQIAEQIGFPVVLKIVSAEISHKTDVGGIALNVLNSDETRRNFALIMDSVARKSPSSSIEGISIQRMITMSSSIELLVGMKRDPQFGTVLLVGAGGITAEIEKDYALELPPFDETTVEVMLRSLRLFPLLNGYRGRAAVNLTRLKETIVRFAQLVQDLPELSAAEINPLLVSKDGVMAVDARMICNEQKVSA